MHLFSSSTLRRSYQDYSSNWDSVLATPKRSSCHVSNNGVVIRINPAITRSRQWRLKKRLTHRHPTKIETAVKIGVGKPFLGHTFARAALSSKYIRLSLDPSVDTYFIVVQVIWPNQKCNQFLAFSILEFTRGYFKPARNDIEEYQ